MGAPGWTLQLAFFGQPKLVGVEGELEERSVRIRASLEFYSPRVKGLSI